MKNSRDWENGEPKLDRRGVRAQLTLATGEECHAEEIGDCRGCAGYRRSDAPQPRSVGSWWRRVWRSPWRGLWRNWLPPSCSGRQFPRQWFRRGRQPRRWIWRPSLCSRPRRGRRSLLVSVQLRLLRQQQLRRVGAPAQIGRPQSDSLQAPALLWAGALFPRIASADGKGPRKAFSPFSTGSSDVALVDCSQRRSCLLLALSGRSADRVARSGFGRKRTCLTSMWNVRL